MRPVENIVLNMSAGLLPEDLSRTECIILKEEYGPNWFTQLGYDEKKYNKPFWIRKLIVDDCPDADGHHTIRFDDGTIHGNTEEEPIATVYDLSIAKKIVEAHNFTIGD